MTDALFTIDADASDQGFDATNAATLALRLKTLPPQGVRSVLFQVFDPAGFNIDNGIAANPPRASKGAPTLILNNGVTTGQSVAPTAVNGTVNVTMPSTGSHSWLVRCTVNGGQKTLPNGRTVPDFNLIHERIIAIRDANGTRAMVPTESAQYEDQGWEGAFEDLRLNGTGGGGGGSLTDQLLGQVLWDDFTGAQPEISGAQEASGYGDYNWNVSLSAGGCVAGTAQGTEKSSGMMMIGASGSAAQAAIWRGQSESTPAGNGAFRMGHVKEIATILQHSHDTDSQACQIYFGLGDDFSIASAGLGTNYVRLRADIFAEANWQMQSSTASTSVTGIPAVGVAAIAGAPLVALRMVQGQDETSQLGNGLWDVYINDFDTPLLTGYPGPAADVSALMGIKIRNNTSVSPRRVWIDGLGFAMFPRTLANRIATP